jgi:hypothetical protein
MPAGRADPQASSAVAQDFDQRRVVLPAAALVVPVLVQLPGRRGQRNRRPSLGSGPGDQAHVLYEDVQGAAVLHRLPAW